MGLPPEWLRGLAEAAWSIRVAGGGSARHDTHALNEVPWFDGVVHLASGLRRWRPRYSNSAAARWIDFTARSGGKAPRRRAEPSPPGAEGASDAASLRRAAIRSTSVDVSVALEVDKYQLDRARGEFRPCANSSKNRVPRRAWTASVWRGACVFPEPGSLEHLQFQGKTESAL